MRDNRRLIGVVMGGNSAFQRDRLMAELMDRGFATAQSLSVSAWTSPRVPPSARYSAASFVPSAGAPEIVRVSAVTKAEPSPSTPVKVATVASLIPAAAPPTTGWVIQVGSFGDSRAAQAALERATGALPDAIRSHTAATVDEIHLAQKTLHRARLTNLSQEEATDGCKRLSQRKIYCSAIQVSAWNTSAR